ncbi:MULTISPECIES: MFS transporter [Serratia]|uniref:Purine ribonucleoside efflux pump nepI n=1 Tax=Serratia ficaria TaxID=61651 RepID=A0A240B491_SERFI|nr:MULTISPECIES: MFS transporter [Serratia]REF46172.1 putative MFS family arabinose efflux permease [Serratia ficaria]CAI0870749.1 Purine ribonucleoside efflux pump nepI [Serratia ficaria]CAI0947294.1 Purine ribonucleoside efflux pump nepI [Serratia ficaria]CAI1002514.1 Purine ribonucleoside efflux pump nepI [Serratia ficaria]CAI1016128.1 Purine ribonucleoside efflux pump nepI [Serratia ficaria]
MSTLSSEVSRRERAYWSGVFAMTLCVFVLIASEFMPVSLLTPISGDLGVSEGLAGQGIAISGALAVLTSLSISTLAGNLDRKVLLLGMTALMAFSGAVIALAPSYLIYMAGRALIGVAIGGFWSLSAATAIRLVPQPQVPRALAIFNGGNALAAVVAAPLGSYLGALIGWRGAFFCLVPVALFAFVWQWFSLPKMKAATGAQPGGAVFRLLADPLVAVGLAACGLFFMGQFALFTYVRPFLETVTRVDIPALSFILLTIGVTGFIGTLLIGAFLQAGFYPTLIAIPLLMAAIAGGLMAFGHSVWIVAPLFGFWGLIATAAPTGWWTWLARTLPNDAEAGGGLMVAVVQLSIALGSTLGGLAFDHRGYQSTFTLSAMLLAMAAALTLWTSRKDR